MLYNKLHKTINSLLKKNYTVEFYTDNNFTIILSFYHLNSVYNGLVYISKENGKIKIDFQYHAINKIVSEQITRVAENVYKLYQLKQFDHAVNILNNYHAAAREIYNSKYKKDWEK
jgi:hypothetical protein